VGNTKWRRHKPDVEITCERKEMATRSQGLPHICDDARLRYASEDMAQGRPTSVVSLPVYIAAMFCPDVGRRQTMSTVAYLSRA